MIRAKKIKIVSKEKYNKLVKKCREENKLLELKLQALEENKKDFEKILASSPITNRNTYDTYVEYLKKYTRSRKDINKTKAKYISNKYYIKWLSLNNLEGNKQNEYIYAKNLYEFILYVESQRKEKIFPYNITKLNRLNHYETKLARKQLKLTYLKNVELRTLEIAHKPTWSTKDKIKKLELQIRDAERKINDIIDSFAARYLAQLVLKLEKAKKDSKAVANAQKLRAERDAARIDVKKLKDQFDLKKKELKETIDSEKQKAKDRYKNNRITRDEYKIAIAKLTDTYHDDIKIMNKLVRDSYYNVSNYSNFDKCHNVVVLNNVVKYYNNGYIATKVLDHVNLTIKKGEFVVILGPSGSGKTTLLNIISGMDNATYGDVLIANENLIDYDQTQLTTFRRRNIGYVFQQYGLLPNLTVKENIQMGQNLQPNKAKILDIDMILESIGMAAHANKYPNELSGGQQQRASIARSIAKNPNILFGDEPTGAIDGEMSKEIMRLFIEVNKQYHTTIIIVTHNPIIADLATMVIQVANGTVAQVTRNQKPKSVDELDWTAVVKKNKK